MRSHVQAYTQEFSRACASAHIHTHTHINTLTHTNTPKMTLHHKHNVINFDIS